MARGHLSGSSRLAFLENVTMPWRPLAHSLSLRLFTLIAVVTLAVLGGLSYAIVRIHTADLREEITQSAIRLSETIKKSTHYSMLKNQKDDVYQIINTIAEQPGLERIRIFNKAGRIIYSTDAKEIGHVIDKQAELCYACHSTDQPSRHLDRSDRIRIYTAPDGNRVMGLINPVNNEEECFSAPCHAHPRDQQILGVLDVNMSLSSIDRKLAEGKQRIEMITYLVMFLIATVSGLFLWVFVHIPVKQLIEGTKRISSGELSYKIPVRSRNEIGILAESFNHMSLELERANTSLLVWAKTLEDKVHEKTKTLRQAQAKLIENERMASLGALAAVVAHEVNNPLSGVLTYARLVQKMLSKGCPDLQRIEEIQQYLGSMAQETARCGEIVKNLLTFARQSRIVVRPSDINKAIERVLLLIRHKLELQSIEMVSELSPDVPHILCDSDQIQQALLAVMINSVEAMPNGGRLDVKTGYSSTEHTLQIVVSDTGIGIPDDVLPRIFEPFFTTKEAQRGVGLGLSIVFGIIQRHHGTIDVTTSVTQGTTMTITLPEHTDVEEVALQEQDCQTTSAGDWVKT